MPAGAAPAGVAPDGEVPGGEVADGEVPDGVVPEGGAPIRLKTGTRAKETTTAPTPERMAAGPPSRAARTFCLAAMATTTGM